jgi:DNA-directed RNA polymerase subunit E'
MFYKQIIKDHIRVPPNLFGVSPKEALIKKIKEKYNGYIDKEIGIVIDINQLVTVGNGIIIPGDGASYYEVEFELITFKPELQEIVYCSVKDIADFGAFMNCGPIEGMIHISQTMDDFVSFSKEKTLTGKESKRILKINDYCKAKIIAVSFKDITNPKIGLTMRQEGLGRLDWLSEEKNNVKAA